MGLDQQDMNRSTQNIQQGGMAQFFPIIIDPTNFKVGQEVEIPVNPCDHVWLPVFFDMSLGINPFQIEPAANNYAVGPFNGNAAVVPFMGMNVIDINDPTGTSSTGMQTQAPIFALRFNTLSNPWLIWSLSKMLTPNRGVVPVGASSLSTMGMGDAMRSITGPIARLWYKLLMPTLLEDVPQTLNYSRVVLLSTLGYSQQTTGFANDYQEMDPSGLVNPLAVTATGYSVSGGGYVTPQLNTVERMAANNATPNLRGRL